MGRRKIEIQPITHERNRSVTFLKRKNGLFKKAYELGVLCSVDVAVIIFEERPGHHVKLYQYGSSDIHDIVQKHLRHDGEKDTRGPSDFSGNTGVKIDDIANDDDDDDVDDDDMPSRSKRRHDGKLKPDLVTGNLDYNSHRNVSVPQPPLSLHLGGQSGSGAGLSVSHERGVPRDLNRRNKLTLGHSRSPSDNPNDPNSGPYAYHGSHSSGPFSGRSSGQYQHHAHPGQHHHSGSGPYQPFFPVSSHPHQSPPPSFIPLQADFPRGSVSSRGAGSGGGFGMPTRSASSNSYDPPMYNNSMLRNQPPGSSQASGPGSGGGGNPDLFAAFLDADEQSRHQPPSQQGPNFVGLDWPVHGSGGGASAAPSGPSSSVSNPSGTSSAGPDPPGGNNPNWLDFLSGNNPNAPNPPPGAGGGGGGGARDSSMSWERGGGPSSGDHRADIGDMFGGDRGRAGSGGGLGGVSGLGGKRKGDDDGPAGSSLASPASVNGRDGKKDGG